MPEKEFNPADYSKKVFSMFGGEEEFVTVEFDSSLESKKVYAQDLASDEAVDITNEMAEDAYQKEWNINGEKVLLGVKKGGN